jgi:hypothetical protein
VVTTRFLFAVALFALLVGPLLGSHRADAAAQDVIEIDLHRLTSISWEPGDPLPEDIRRLHGRRVVMRGFMHASVIGDQRKFPMVTEACQCTSSLLPHHFVEVDLGPENRTGPRTGQFEVIGRLEIGEVEEDGYVVSLYRLKGRFY